MEPSAPLNYSRLPQSKRGGFQLVLSILSIGLALAAGVIGHWFYAGVFDNFADGDDWLIWGTAGFALSISAFLLALMGATGRYRKFAVLAIVLSVAVFLYGVCSPMPRNVPLP